MVVVGEVMVFVIVVVGVEVRVVMVVVGVVGMVVVVTVVARFRFRFGGISGCCGGRRCCVGCWHWCGQVVGWCECWC